MQNTNTVLSQKQTQFDQITNQLTVLQQSNVQLTEFNNKLMNENQQLKQQIEL